MDDFIPSLDSDAEVDVVASSDDEIVLSKQKNAKRRRVDTAAPQVFADLVDAGSNARESAAPIVRQSAWSFKSAIEKIDADAPASGRKGTTLAEKVAAHKQSKEAAAAKKASRREEEKADVSARSSKKATKVVDTDDMDLLDGEEVEEVDEEEEVDGGSTGSVSEGEGNDASEDESGSSEDEGGEGDGDDSDDDTDGEDAGDSDDSGNEDASVVAGGGAVGAAVKSHGAADSDDGDDADDDDDDDDDDEVEGDDVVDAIMASAKPNPFRAASERAPMDSLNKEYAALFTADPFNRDAVRPMAGKAAAGGTTSSAPAVSGSKRSRAAMESGGAGGGGGDEEPVMIETPVIVTGLADGTALKEPRSFNEMNLSRPLLRAIAELGFRLPTPIQRRCVPLSLAGHDICGSAVTGSGKTAAYLLPILERLLYKPSRVPAIRVLILTPTRELATQVHSMCQQLCKFCPDIRSVVATGGLALKPQEAELRTRPDIVIATPGRILDHIRNTVAVHFDDIDVLVLDEADRLLEMGFEEEVNEIVKACPVGRQTLLFSATMTARVDTLASLSLRKPIRVVADPLYDMASRLSQEFVRIRPGKEDDREAMLLALLTRSFTGGGVLVFAIHKRTAHRLAIITNMAGLKVAELHGNLSQRQRLAALEDFREGRVDYLIATDLAGRGLDIAGVRAVINFEMPRELTAYVHRVGRTARAGRSGVAITLVSEGQRAMMKEIVKRATLNVKSRIIAPAAVSEWKDRIEGWAGDIEEIGEAEHLERTLRLAEMETTKAENILHHKDEIMSRPARTWFQTETQKVDKRKALAELVEAGGVPKADKSGDGKDGKGKEKAPKLSAKDKEKKLHRLTRAKRRRLLAVEEAEKDERKVKKAEEFAAKEAKAAARSGKRDGDGEGGSDKPVKIRLDPEMAKLKREVELNQRAQGLGVVKSAKASVRDTANKLGVTQGVAKRIMERDEKKARGGSGGKKKPASRGAPAAGAGGGGDSDRGGSGSWSGPKGAFDSELKDATHGVAANKHKVDKGPLHKPSRKSFKSMGKFKRR